MILPSFRHRPQSSLPPAPSHSLITGLGPYEQMAAVWWDSLNADERERWLDAAADGRERSILAAFTLMGDVLALPREAQR